MSKKCVHYSSEFKAKVALAAIRGDETIPQLAARYGIHPTQSRAGNGNSLNKQPSYFPEMPVPAKRTNKPQMDLHRVIGQLMVERDFLARKLDH